MTIEFKIIPAYQAAEAAEAAELDASTTLGIEVTVPAVAAKCGLGNIDHHGEGCTSATPAACEQVFNKLFSWQYSSHGEERQRGSHLCSQLLRSIKTVISNTPDSDTLVAMCLIKIEAEQIYYHNLYDVEAIVHEISAIDRLGALSAVNSNNGSRYVDDPDIKAIIALSGSRTMSLEQQINEVVQILTVQEISEAASKAVEESDKLFAAAKAASKVTLLDNGIVLVESSHHAATRIGYEHGDVLICLNKKMKKDFKNPEAGTYRKFTVCKRDENVQAVINFDRLNELEEAVQVKMLEYETDGEIVKEEQEVAATWGGRSTVGGSPQGVDSTLTVEQVFSCIKL